ncbi:MAG: ATP-dependent DNA helicase RecG, partial [Pseudomonadales bacterium]|nr:ATP-dependent DNA helicase RecG [Pseudomonadales bacterium]
RQLAQQSLQLLDEHPFLEELLPTSTRFHIPKLGIAQIIHFLHQPPVQDISPKDQSLLEQQRHPLQQKLALEELVAHQLSLLRSRRKIRTQIAPSFPLNNKFSNRFLDALPFQLTASQQRVIKDIASDLATSKPMLRLLQGDVGSGKTLVAAMAALQAVAGGHQVALMAPTEILAEQHFKNFQRWMMPLSLTIAWLSGKQPLKQRREQQALILDGTADIIIGTHALFQKEVTFDHLGLVIIDEQHRFGVHQRLALREKGIACQSVPHQLIMTATPIPRTLAMCAYADLDCSIIDELPPGRLPIETLLISDSRRAEVINRVRNICSQGRQVYWVCTLIEESEALQCQAAQATAELLSVSLPELRIGLIHGRLKPDEKTTVMDLFSAGEIQVLVATTVIEVGVDVPNASLMIIENPERLGLAQLHQLRGRVGRGSKQSYCILMYSSPLGEDSKKRLATMRQTQDGFVIAEKDLELRGPGEVLGTRQTGIMQFKIADLQRDQDLIPLAQECAQNLIREKSQSINPLIRRWLATEKEYGQV